MQADYNMEQCLRQICSGTFWYKLNNGFHYKAVNSLHDIKIQSILRRR